MADKKISQLDSASSVSSGAYFPISQSGTTYKGTTDQIGEQIATNQDFSGLNTTSKKIVGAINEILTTSNILNTIDTPASVMTFNDGGDNIPVNKLLVAVTAQQAGSGTPSPSNPRAITGWSQAQISVSDGVTPQTVTIAFGDTYYGGILDVTNGKLTVTHKIEDLGNYTWTLSSDIFYNTVSDKENTNANYVICSCFEPVHDNAISVGNATTKLTSDNQIIASISTGTPRFYVRADSYLDETSFTSAVTGQKVVYELATPVIINLIPEQIATLSGTNQISADCGDIQLLEYFNENADDIAELHRAMSDDFHIYSTAEQIVGKWIDGSDLYEKTFTADNVSSSASQLIAHGINAGIMFVESAYAQYTQANTTFWATTSSYYSNVQNEEFKIVLSETNIIYKVGSYINGGSVAITIRYTKAS